MPDDNSSNSQHTFTGGLPPEFLEEILQRIDENLAMRSLLRGSNSNQDSDPPSRDGDFLSLPFPPNVPAFFERIAEIRSLRAPFYVIDGNPVSKLVKMLHNQIVKVFGRQQSDFNNLTLNLLDSLTAHLFALYEYERSQTALINALARQISAHIEQFSALQSEAQQLAVKVDQPAAQQDRLQQLTAKVDQLAVQQDNHQLKFEKLDNEQRGQDAWIDLVSRKTEMASLNVRELMASPSLGGKDWPEPHIADPEKYATRLSEMKDRVKVNLGCGEKPLSDYLNVDLRPLPDVDIIADVHRLPFEPGTVFELSSAHLVEHFREHHARLILLPYWKGLLRPNGQLRVICPNWTAMLERLNSGHMSLAMFKKITFGAQDYEGDDHFAMYTPDTLENLLKQVGFSRVERVVVDRMNGDCPEMELLARL